MKRGERTTINGISLMSLNGSNHRRVRDFFLSFFPFSLFFFQTQRARNKLFFHIARYSTNCFAPPVVSHLRSFPMFCSCPRFSLSLFLSLYVSFFFFNLYKHVVELHGINGKETERNSKNLVKFTLVSCYKN